MENLGEVLTLDNALLVVLLVFMALWHRRTMARDKAFFELQGQMMVALMECVREKVAPRD